jgi:hypothetical protein
MEAKVRKGEEYSQASSNGFLSSSSSSPIEDSYSFFSPSSVRRRGVFINGRPSACSFQNIAIIGFFILISLVFLIDSTSAQSSLPKHTKSQKHPTPPTSTPTPRLSTNCSSGGEEEGSSSNDCHDGDDDDGQEITDAIVLREVLKLTVSIGLALLTVVGLGVMWPRWRSQVVSVTEVGQGGGLGGKSFRLFDDEEGELEDAEGTELDTIN